MDVQSTLDPRDQISFLLEEKFSCLNKEDPYTFLVKRIEINNIKIASILLEINKEIPTFIDLQMESESKDYDFYIKVINNIVVGYQGESESKRRGKIKAIKNMVSNIEKFIYIFEKIVNLCFVENILRSVKCEFNKTSFVMSFSKGTHWSETGRIDLLGNIASAESKIKVFYHLQFSQHKQMFVKFSDFEKINSKEDLENLYSTYCLNSAIHHK
jgi:hypothetical protein